MGYILLGAALVFNAVANILLKLGSGNFAAVRAEGLMRAVFTNYFLIAGIALFACNVILYALALSRLQLSVGYPIMVAGGFVIVNGYALLFLGEQVSFAQIFGYVLILAGMALVLVKNV